MGSGWRESGVLELLMGMQCFFIMYFVFFSADGSIIYSFVNDHLDIYHHLIILCLKTA